MTAPNNAPVINAVPEGAPACCSGDDLCCPDNEGFGCFCTATSLKQDVMGLFSRCGFEVRDSGQFAVCGTIDSAALVVEALTEAAPAAPQAVPDLERAKLYPLSEYAPGQWWLTELENLFKGGKFTLDTKRAAGVALNFANAYFAAPVAQAVPVASEWISVDERLPENEAQVWASGANFGDYEKGRFVVAVTFLHGTFHDDEDGEEIHDPSHWMPRDPKPTPPAPGAAK